MGHLLELPRVCILLDLTEDVARLFQGLKLLDVESCGLSGDFLTDLDVEFVEFFNTCLKIGRRMGNQRLVVAPMLLLLVLLEDWKDLFDHV